MNISATKTRLTGAAFLLFLGLGSISAQFNEARLMIGTSYYKGDLANTIEPTEMNTTFGLGFRKNYSRRFAAGGQLTRGVLSATDKNGTSLAQRQRNLSFRTEYIELNASAEYHLSKLDILDGKNSAPFVSAGLGVMYFNPQAAYRGMYYDLQPLGTEGQGLTGGRKKYSRFAAQIPVGLGFKWALSTRVIIQAQALKHFAFTDYLDDVSGKYADISLLNAVNPTAGKLAYRTPEILQDPTPENPNGKQRGDNKKFDGFTTIQIGASFVLNARYDMEWNDQFRIYDEAKPQQVKKKKKFRLFKRKKVMTGAF